MLRLTLTTQPRRGDRFVTGVLVRPMATGGKVREDLAGTTTTKKGNEKKNGQAARNEIVDFQIDKEEQVTKMVERLELMHGETIQRTICKKVNDEE